MPGPAALLATSLVLASTSAKVEASARSEARAWSYATSDASARLNTGELTIEPSLHSEVQNGGLTLTGTYSPTLLARTDSDTQVVNVLHGANATLRVRDHGSVS